MGAGAGAAGAQVDSTPRPDTTGRAAADTAHRDTMPVLLPRFPAPLPPGPLPAGTRYVFTADSLAFSNIYTLSDLLAHIPGVYVARAGYLGQAEPALYGGRGAQGLEVFWDGVPYLPVGRDSVFLDPARISLSAVERVDVIVLPGALRVYLGTGRWASTEPLTEVRIATGELGIAAYHGAFARRWRSGFGLSIDAESNNVDGEGSPSSSSSFRSTDVLVKLEYVPTPHVGMKYQILSSTWKRGGRTGVVDPWNSTRHDASLHFFLAARDDGRGPRLDVTLASSRVDGDTMIDSLPSERSFAQGALALSHAWSRGSAGATLRFQGSDRPVQVEARAAWMPVPVLVVSADARHSAYGPWPHRTGDRVHAAAGLSLPLGFSVHGDAAIGNDLQAPAMAIDSARQTTDYSGALRWERAFVTLQAGGGRRGAFIPLGFASGVKTVAGLGPTPRTDYVTAQVSVRPLPGLELSGWYSDPVGGGGDFEPAHHARYSATFYSKFWRVYRSGIFALRGEVAAESWSVGTAQGLGGRDSLGNQLPLPGATFVETNVEMRIGGLTLFWVIRNLSGMRASYVDGLGYPKQAQYYGARWLFRN